MACTQSSQCTLDSHVVCRYCRCPADYKAGRAGLECRTEEELDEKVAEMEHSIQHDGLTLNVSGPTAVLWPRQLGSVQFVHGCWQHVSLARKHGKQPCIGQDGGMLYPLIKHAQRMAVLTERSQLVVTPACDWEPLSPLYMSASLACTHTSNPAIRLVCFTNQLVPPTACNLPFPCRLRSSW
jgi:hypothetical protein